MKENFITGASFNKIFMHWLNLLSLLCSYWPKHSVRWISNFRSASK